MKEANLSVIAALHHVTRYRYDAPVRESIMQLFMQPKSEGAQRLHSFLVSTSPRSTLQAYQENSLIANGPIQKNASFISLKVIPLVAPQKVAATVEIKQFCLFVERSSMLRRRA